MNPATLRLVVFTNIEQSNEWIASNIEQTSLQAMMLGEDPLPES